MLLYCNAEEFETDCPLKYGLRHLVTSGMETDMFFVRCELAAKITDRAPSPAVQ